MRLGEAKGRRCQPLGHPVFWRHSGKQVLPGALVSTIPQTAQLGVRAGEERGQAAQTPGSSALLWEWWWFPAPWTQHSWVHRRFQSPTLGPCAFLDPQPTPFSGAPPITGQEGMLGPLDTAENPPPCVTQLHHHGSGRSWFPGAEPLWVFSDI